MFCNLFTSKQEQKRMQSLVPLLKKYEEQIFAEHHFQ